jgi:hypothetical protein
VSKNSVIVGVADHNGWAVLVTVAGNGQLVDRRRVELVEEGLPVMPYHHDAQGLPLEEALDLVERVRVSAGKHARLALDTLAREVTSRVRGIAGIAIRRCPQIPPTVAGRLANYRAQNVADTVMYRNALAGAGEERGWAVHWYDRKRVIDEACRMLGVADLEPHLLRVRKSVGPPWTQDHKVAMAAAIAASPRASRER